MPSASSSQSPTDAPTGAPRGRIAAGCVVFGGSLWVFGGSCESGPRQEVTLDDLWRLPLEIETSSGSEQAWECVLTLSERAMMWFDSESEDDDDEDEECEAGQVLANVDNR